MTLLEVNARLRVLLDRQIQRGSMSNKLLAKKTAIGQSHLSNFLRQRRQLSVKSLSQVINALGFELELLPKIVRLAHQVDEDNSAMVPYHRFAASARARRQ